MCAAWKIHVSGSTIERLQLLGGFSYTERGTIDIKVLHILIKVHDANH